MDRLGILLAHLDETPGEWSHCGLIANVSKITVLAALSSGKIEREGHSPHLLGDNYRRAETHLDLGDLWAE